MLVFSLVVEILVAVVMLVITVFAGYVGRREGLVRERGFAQIQLGFALLLLGALVDLSDHFPQLSDLVVLGQTPYQTVVEKVVGFLGGFACLAVGLWRWLPALLDRQRSAEGLRLAHRELEQQAQKDSVELALKTLDLEREIRERQEAATALKRSEDLLETVLANAPIALLATDPVGRITLARGSALPSVGVEGEDVAGRSAFDLFADEPEALLALERALEGEPVAATVRMHDAAFQYQYSVWFTLDGAVAGVIAVAMDVSEREAAQRELRLAKEAAEDANRAKSQFLANMSHELRTPLNSVIGFANILAKNKQQSLTPQELRYLERIRENGRHLLNLINEILDLSRIEAGRVELVRDRVDLRQLIEETLAQLQGERGQRPLELRAELPAEAAPLDTDAVKLKQVLINLLSNALKFTTAGRVTVRLEVEPATGVPRRIAVADTGIGIPADRLTTIFEAFQQVDSSTSRNYGGTGLGLSISRSLCRAMGYALEVTSEVGRGSTFTVVLAPALPEAATLPAEARPEVAVLRPAADLAETGAVAEPDVERLAGKRILVIDDSADSRLLLMQYFEDLGCRPLSAASGEEGLHLARLERPDLITLDLMMPNMDGWEVLALLKRDPALARIPVVVVSVVAKEQRGTLLGAVEALSKPVEREQLLAVLHRTLVSGPAEVLVVDDEEDQRFLLSQLLAEQGIRVRTAATGPEALAELEQGLPALLLLDLSLPEMDGASFLRAIRTDGRYRHLPVVIVTGQELSPDELRGLERSASAVLFKSKQLHQELQQILAGFAAGQEVSWKSSEPITGGA